MSLLHLNVRSIAKKLDHLRNYLKLLTHEFAIIGFTETWFNDVTVSRYKLENYNQVSNYRRTKKGGGVTLSIHKSITFKERQEWKVLNPNIETVFAELEKTFFKTPKNVLIGVIYRPPNSDVNSFIEQLADILHKLARENKLVYLMGDFNINLFNFDKYLLTNDFLNLMYTHSYIPLITKATRVYKSSATLIDNIFTNTVGSDNMNGVLMTDISDHFPIYTITKHIKEKEIQRTKTIRVTSEVNIKKFKDKLLNIDWHPVFSTTNPQDGYTLLQKTLINIYDEVFPVKEIKQGYKNKLSWLSVALKNGIKKKNKLYI